MILVHDTSSECALQMYEVFSYGFQAIERTRFCDGQADGCKAKTNMFPEPSTGRHKY